MSPFARPHAPHIRRRGTALLVALVCIALAVGILYGMVRAAYHGRKEVDLRARQSQARWLKQSAVERAITHLAADENYTGEHWTLPAPVLGGRYEADIQITVTPPTTDETEPTVRVVADYPTTLPQRVRQTSQFRMPAHPIPGE